MVLNNPLFVARNSRSSYQIEQSLRFNDADSPYLSRTPGSAGNRRTWTISFWIKRAQPRYTYRQLFSAGASASADRINVFFGGAGGATGDGISFGYNPNNAGWSYVATSAVLRDFSAWYHIVIAVDTTQATASNRVKIYINGVLQSDLATATYPSQNVELAWNNNVYQVIGAYNLSGATNLYTDAYFAEFYGIDGSALAPTIFGELDNNGVWRPIKYAGSYSGNSFYLKFDAADVDGDSSGLGNDWTASAGISTSGTGTDVMSDTPTTNYPTGNPLASNNPSSVSEGNLKFVGDPANVAANGMHTTMGMSSGKWYFEVDINVAGGARTVGILPADAFAKSGKTTTTNYDTYYNNGALSYNGYNGNKVEGFGSTVTFTSYGNTWTTNDVVGVAFDADNGKLFFAKNNTWQNSGDPVAGTNAAFTGISGTYVAHSGGSQGFTATFNFGQRAFAYTPPTGFKPLNTSNLSAPTVKDGSKNFNTVLYAGNSTTLSVTGVNFQPDLVWIKNRDSTYTHSLQDSVRGFGTNTTLRTDTNVAEDPGDYGYVSQVSSDGFTVTEGSLGPSRVNGAFNYVAWNWLAGGSGSSISAASIDGTNPTIASTVSANPTAGFSIVTYTGNGTAGATIGHGLGVAPKMIIVKQRSGATDWQIGHQDIGWTKTLYFTTAAATTETGAWNNTAPTSTVFSVGTSRANTSSATYVAYCFSEVEGYSKFGSFTGNGNVDSPFVYCGFKPAWAMFKQTTSTNTSCHWFIFDTTRKTYNVIGDEALAADKNWEEGLGNNWNPNTSNSMLDILSNGFKIRTTSTSGWNTNGATYIFAAFAEHPFGGSGVSPATAR